MCAYIAIRKSGNAVHTRVRTFSRSTQGMGRWSAFALSSSRKTWDTRRVLWCMYDLRTHRISQHYRSTQRVVNGICQHNMWSTELVNTTCGQRNWSTQRVVNTRFAKEHLSLEPLPQPCPADINAWKSCSKQLRLLSMMYTLSFHTHM